jgi:hypothetical protein
MAPERLAPAVAAFVARDPRAWPGLAKGVPLDALAEHLPVDRTFTGAAPLGERFELADWVAGLHDDFPDGVRVWLRNGRVVMLDAQGMDLTASAGEVLAGLGDPAARLDAFLGPIAAPRSEWVYPERGLTLFVGGERAWVDRILGYTPVALDDYVARLRPHTRVDPVPDAGGAG